MSDTVHRAYIAIGSNVGDRRAHVDFARAALAALPDTQLVAFSSVHETAPVGPQDQGPYLNAAAAIDTQLSPEALIERFQRIEKDAGRERVERWGPRTLDVDLLLYGHQIISTDELTVPHPLMHERWFVLKPLSEIAPDAIHPMLQMTVAAMLSNVEETGGSGAGGTPD